MYCICTFPAAHLDIEEYLAIKDFFESASWSNEVPNGYGKLKLEQTGARHKVGDIEFTSRKKTSNKWFETQDQIKYMDDFSKQKIIFPAIMSKGPFFALDNGGFMVVAPGNVLTGNIQMEQLLLFLTTIGYWLLRRFYMGGGIEGELKVNRLEALPVPIWLANARSAEDYYIRYDFTTEEIKLISSSVKA